MLLPPAPAPATTFPNPSTSSDVLQLILPALQALTDANHASYGLLPLYYPHQSPPPFGAALPAPPVPPTAVQPPPTPPVVLPRAISLDEYCDHYQINADDRRVLVELGYEPSDDGIKELEKEVWDATKVTPLAKGLILHQHFIKDVIAGLWN
ncbi:putative proline-rich protein [Mycena venus]|uniref:Putative proline-rich protein n=1 Tax=Mycena venus TaxID=2733690 RepID=A0A8H7CSS5_9AGAR|nr:putative proline-rich protein [Mycena venus]